MIREFGAFKPKLGEPAEIFPVKAIISNPVDPIDLRDGSVHDRKSWPYNEKTKIRPTWKYCAVSLINDITKEVLTTFRIPLVPGMQGLSENTMYDVLEYLIYNFGTPPQSKDTGINQYDLALPFLTVIPNTVKQDESFNIYQEVILKRAIGCRLFVFKSHLNQRPFQVVVGNAGIESHITRHETPILLVKADTAYKISSSVSGISQAGFAVHFKQRLESGEFIGHTYYIPMNYRQSIEETAQFLLGGAKDAVKEHTTFSDHDNTDDPDRLLKVVVSDDFWYLKSKNGRIIVTLVKHAPYKAMGAVYEKLKAINDLDRDHLVNLYGEIIARITMHYEDEDYARAIVLDSIGFIDQHKL